MAKGHEELFEQYRSLKGEVASADEECKKKQEEASKLSDDLAAKQKELKPLEEKLEEALAEEIKSQRANLTNANKALKKGDLRKAYSWLKGENPDKKDIYDSLCLLIDSSGSWKNTGPGEDYSFDIVGKGAREVIAIGAEPVKVGRKMIELGRNYAVINFSSRTLYSGWVAPEDTEKLNKFVDEFQEEGTTLSSRKLEQLQKEAKGKFAMLMVTDGCLDNSCEAITMLNRMVEQGNKLGVLYIGRDIDWARGAYGRFADVFYCEDNQEIKDMMRQYARHVFQGSDIAVRNRKEK